MDRGRLSLAEGGVCSPAADPAADERDTMSLPGRAKASEGASGDPAAERRLVGRVFRRWHGAITEACRYSSVPPEFLGALVANESGGNPQVIRFEPTVYRHLQAVAQGKRAAYAGLSRRDLDSEVAEMLHPKAGSFHAAFLTGPFRGPGTPELAAREDEALRELASSWGLTQIMGYHLVGRPGTVRDLLEPRFHFRLALELLAQFAEYYQLDLKDELAELFRCWNTGQPYGQTFAPDYVEKGLRRMATYRTLSDLAIA